jgi:nicotinate-nucleotide pyrophosphorylase (carboxylating)
LNPIYVEDSLKKFLEEDLGILGDITSFPAPDKKIRAELLAKEDLVLCGKAFTESVFKLLDRTVFFEWKFEEGDEVSEGAVLCEISGSAKAILGGERTALNLLQRLSGIATETRKFVKVLEGTGIRILDTRKTTPGLRYFEKYAVRVGGGINHRMGLYDMILIKDNHIKVFGSLKEAILRITAEKPAYASVEVEVENWKELEEVVSICELVDAVMFDNWKVEELEKGVNFLKSRCPKVIVEVSGGITLEKLEKIKHLPVDFVSSGSIITKATWKDISLEVR